MPHANDPSPSRKAKFDDFTLGYLAAAAQAARAGEDTLAVEMLAVCGIRHSWEIDGKGLERFDKTPLARLLRMEDGR